MDLLLLLALLYAWECLSSVPSNAVVFQSSPFRIRARLGGGLRFLNPWPSATCLVSSWFPLALEGTDVCTAVAIGRTGLPVDGPDTRCHPLSESANIEAADRTLKIDGRPVLRASSHSDALYLAALCSKFARARPGDRARRWRAALRYSWNTDLFTRERGRARKATRWLARLCDASIFTLFAVTPIAILVIGEEAALLATAPALLGLHLATVTSLYLADRALPSRSRDGQRLLVGLLYPPSLWRAPQELRSELLTPFQPLTVAAVLLKPVDFTAFAGRRLAVLDSWNQICHPEEGATDVALERRVLERLAKERDLEPQALRRPPPRDPEGAFYCPVCRAAYVSGVSTCSDCQVPTRAWAATPV